MGNEKWEMGFYYLTLGAEGYGWIVLTIEGTQSFVS
jgi:hypothetical protein